MFNVLAETTPDKFGWTVALSGDGNVLAVGAEGKSADTAESDVYLYRYSAANNAFRKEITFTRSNARNHGIDLDLDDAGAHLIIGDNQRRTGASTNGAVDGYRYNGQN